MIDPAAVSAAEGAVFLKLAFVFVGAALILFAAGVRRR
jgi:hypothetical protein